MIIFACISPHPPIILPSVGSKEDRKKVKKTIESLEKSGEKLKELNPDTIIISSPHPDWGFNVPLHYLAEDFKGEIKQYLIGLESPQFYFEQGKKVYHKTRDTERETEKIALIASADLSHCLREDGPYGFQPDGPKFDKDLTEALKKKDTEKIFKLDDLYPEAGECGLRSICFMLGMLEAHSINSGQDWKAEILSYEAPFGVGYLVVNFNVNK